ncbi:uncharacterized protein Z520_09027 [Fonsecaea multimorphosa CBS 102226]|uniref:Uncharacterized protein n=1 Tax=Fonsecaea multimorphosa CBS 102226 TaxID=1442371 RepID=A0A0D2ID97_9EURO|nr:uncharacterized protein Z520_09027 [Fonsecaea multimorphosa CBS 102226]KIX95111.1 hypothetical protein Z520_09027 [Fonsecaea multimorphosa CBS 102226]
MSDRRSRFGHGRHQSNFPGGIPQNDTPRGRNRRQEGRRRLPNQNRNRLRSRSPPRRRGRNQSHRRAGSSSGRRAGGRGIRTGTGDDDGSQSRRSRSRSSRGDSVPEEHERPETGRPQNGQTFNYEEVMKWLIREKPEPNLPGLDHEACKKFITVCSGIADDLEKEISVIRRTVATFIESRPEIRGSRFLLHAFWLPVLHVLAVDPPAQRSVKGMHLFTWPNVELQYWRGRELFAEEYPQVVQAMNW